jgi:hypothetical protein
MENNLYTQKETLELLKQNGINITLRTIQKYIKEKIVPIPVMSNSGINGRIIPEYTLECISQIYANWNMLNNEFRITKLKLNQIRKIALYILDNEYTTCKNMFDDNYLKKELNSNDINVFLLTEWLKFREKLFYIEGYSESNYKSYSINWLYRFVVKF